MRIVKNAIGRVSATAAVRLNLRDAQVRVLCKREPDNPLATVLLLSGPEAGRTVGVNWKHINFVA